MGRRTEEIIIVQNLFQAFRSVFPLQRNSKIHIFIQCLHLIATFFQSVLLALKLLIEQFLQAVCNSCCGNSLCTSAGNAALCPYVTTAA